jgi:hypothetical protein
MSKIMALMQENQEYASYLFMHSLKLLCCFHVATPLTPRPYFHFSFRR